MTVAPYRAGQRLGWAPAASVTGFTNQINAAANWFAMSFVADSARTLSAVRAFISAVAGTPGASGVTCDLYDSTGTSGAPGSSIEAGILPSATITASGWFDFTGFTTALTSGLTYWLVFKNANGTPASNNVTFGQASGSFDPLLQGTSLARLSWSTGTSTNTGSTWALQTAPKAGLRVGYADGSYDGMPVQSVAASAVGSGVYSTRELGVKFTTPANGVLNVLGLALSVATKTGSPTGNIQLGLWTGTSPVNLAYTNAIPGTVVTTAQWIYAYFPSVQTIQPGTIVRVTLAETTQSDASGNRFNLAEYTWDTDSNSLILLPWEGTAVKTYFDGSSWTDTPGSIFGHALLLDTAGEFGSGGGAGSAGAVIGPSNILMGG